LLEWHKNSMDARKTLKTAQKYLAALDEQRRTVPYDPTHGELIRFEDWLRQKGS